MSFKKGNAEWKKGLPMSEKAKDAVREGVRKRTLRKRYNLPLVKEQK